MVFLWDFHWIPMGSLWYFHGISARFADEGLQPGTGNRMGDLLTVIR